MKITITIDGAEQNERDKLNAVFLAFKSQSLVSVKKLGGALQEWTFSCIGVTQAVLVSINYVNTVVNINNTVNTNTDIKGIEKEEERIVNTHDEAPEPTIVNDTPKSRAKNLELFSTRLVAKQEVRDFIDFWNQRIWLPRIRGTDRQCREIRSALSRPLFAETYQEGVGEVAKSKFLRGALPGRDGVKFKFDLDWFLNMENFDKIIEGKYRDNETDTQPTERKYTEEKL